MHRIFTTRFAEVYPLYVTKVKRKGRAKSEVDEVIRWLTGYDQPALQQHLDSGTTFEQFFADARLNPNASAITGVVCGVRVESVEDPLNRSATWTSWSTNWPRASRWRRSSAERSDLGSSPNRGRFVWSNTASACGWTDRRVTMPCTR